MLNMIFNLIKICVHAINQPHLTPFDLVWPVWPFWPSFAPEGSFCPRFSLFDPVWTRVTLFGIIWHHLAPFGPDWPHLALFGHSSILISRYFKVPIHQGVVLCFENCYLLLNTM